MTLATRTLKVQWWDLSLYASLVVVIVFFPLQVEESLNEMDFQLSLDLFFTDGDYSYVEE